ncbi:MAG: DUF3883 domain-containing protein [Patescibacteria group bacterium]
MKPQNELALIVAYYLSRFDKQGYSLLGYKSFTDATKGVGLILGVKPRTIQGMRDEFDPYHQNDRVGWVRELRGSRLKTFKTFQETDDVTLLEIVKEILQNKEFKNTEEYQDIHALLGERAEPSKRDTNPVFILRGPTGKAAETFFLEYFKNKALPIAGKIIDSRDFGCGYDFEINDGKQSHFVEVKGIASADGGILFTNKEWQTALKYGEKYYLVIVKNISAVPEITVIQNPASKFKPQKNVYTTLQVNWSVSNKVLSHSGESPIS